jgi:hypothetical protein
MNEACPEIRVFWVSCCVEVVKVTYVLGECPASKRAIHSNSVEQGRMLFL